MKSFFAAVFAFCALAAAATPLGKAVNFGPRGCVKLSRSAAGSCVISLNCDGLDTSKVEFAFNCVGKGIVRHSFGVGGFESNEEFDTDMKCARCDLATAIGSAASKPSAPKSFSKPIAPAKQVASKVNVLAKKPVPQKANTGKAGTNKKEADMKAKVVAKKDAEPVIMRVEAKNTAQGRDDETLHQKVEEVVKVHQAQVDPTGETRREESQDAAKYGPNGCVSVHRSKEGHCIMSTDCKQSDISSYEFGLVCVDQKGYPIKHLFGKDSFDAVETFDTLIKCDQCLGLENVPDQTALAGEVSVMSKDVASLKLILGNLSTNLKMLNDKVFAKAPPPAPAPVAVVAAAPASAALVSHRHRHHHLRHSHRRHHHHHHHHPRHEEDSDAKEPPHEENQQQEEVVDYYGDDVTPSHYDIQEATNEMLKTTRQEDD